MMDKIEFGIFLAVIIAFIVCGCIFTRKPKKGAPSAAQQENKPYAGRVNC